MSGISRRNFVVGSAGLISSSMLLQVLGAHTAQAAGRTRGGGNGGHGGGGGRRSTPWGDLAPVPDQNGVAHLALPPGFTYRSFSGTGSMMSDGTLTPQHHDGMRAFAGPRGTIRLIRNHEINASRGTTAVPFPVNAQGAARYDGAAKGGAVTIDYDPRTGAIRDFVSLAGTIYNCGGGVGYDGRSWLSGEETTYGTARGFEQDHGYIFQVPVDAEGPVAATPLKALGRFNHEAAVTDPKTGIVYLTEDRYGSACGFYRFVPADKRNLAAGGTLQMLAIRNQDHYDTRKGQRVNKALPVRWVTIAQPDAGIDDPGDFSTTPATIRLGAVASQGFDQGAAAFDRLEGAYASSDGSIFFVSTSGGDVPQPAPNAFLDAFTGAPYVPGYGQIWELKARANGGDGILRLVYESPGSDVLDAPDNLVLTPGGGLLLCEDDTAWTDGDVNPVAPNIVNPNRIVGVNKQGRTFELAVQLIPRAPDASKGGSTSNEFSGACFSPDGKTFFVNLYGDGTPDSGHTFAITGPWSRGGC